MVILHLKKSSHGKERNQVSLPNHQGLRHHHPGHAARSGGSQPLLDTQSDHHGRHHGHLANHILGHRTACAVCLFCHQRRFAHSSPKGVGLAFLRENHLCRLRLHTHLLAVSATRSRQCQHPFRPEVHGLHGGRRVHGHQRGPRLVGRRQHRGL